jgi:hypothetical protein
MAFRFGYRIAGGIVLAGVIMLGGTSAALADDPASTPPYVGAAQISQSLALSGSQVRLDGSGFADVDSITVDGNSITAPFATPGWTVSITDSVINVALPWHATDSVSVTVHSVTGEASAFALFVPDPARSLDGLVEVPATGGARAFLEGCRGSDVPTNSVDDFALPTAVVCGVVIRFPDGATPDQTFLVPVAGILASSGFPSTLPYADSLFPTCGDGVANGSLVGINATGTVPYGDSQALWYTASIGQPYPNGDFGAGTLSFFGAYCRPSHPTPSPTPSTEPTASQTPTPAAVGEATASPVPAPSPSSVTALSTVSKERLAETGGVPDSTVISEAGVALALLAGGTLILCAPRIRRGRDLRRHARAGHPGQSPQNDAR